MRALPLRLRVFLFFCFLAGGGIAVTGAALWLGHARADEGAVASAFVASGIVAAFGLLGLTTFVWLLFDRNVARPIEALAGKLRVRTHGGVARAIDADVAPYLGDLAPAAAAIHARLSELGAAAGETAADEIARLRRQRGQLLRVLSDIPLAILVMNRAHQIALYDGQAIALMTAEAPVRLNGSIFDYLERETLLAALGEMAEDGGMRRAIVVTGRSGTTYAGHLRRFPEGGYTLMLESLARWDERPPVFDLDLLEREGPARIEEATLRDLCFVVFDTETTGLDPMRDAVVQIGAVRVVSGKPVEGEAFETLVDPGRPIPPASTAVHGIDDATVAGAPKIDAALARFHDFAQDAVIVAHNAPFDMAFLRRDAPEGILFDHPVLDTVHLSAIVFGGSAEHTLDALCDRLAIDLPMAERHTAMGDARATAAVLAALIPVLEARGFATLAAVRKEARKHRRILEDASG
jgi:DNA polymerase-3 subunit epsilon